MPLGVTGWPYSPDFRTTALGPVGYAWGAVAPWAWRISSTDAEAPFEWLNDSDRIAVREFTLRSINWTGRSGQAELFKLGWQEGSGFPLGVSVFYELQLFGTGADPHQGERLADWPLAIEQFTIVVEPTGIGDNRIPNPVQFDPLRFDQDVNA